jgi:8-oxo-dGTP pyrophosphatase MutT (NUDIX family)
VTLRSDALRVLQSWSAPPGDQDALRLSFAEHLERHEDGMWRSCAPAHITASALVMDPDGSRVLLTLHAKIGRWLQTGGHCEPGDLSLGGAALREATEESGIDGLELSAYPVAVDRHEVSCGGPGTRFDHLDVQYVAVAPPGAVERRSEESADLRWFGVDDLPEPTDPALRRLVERARRTVPTP